MKQMYKNDEKRIILQDINFLVYVADSKDIDDVIKEIVFDEDYNNEEIMIVANDVRKDYIAVKKDNTWIAEETTTRSMYYR